MIQKFLENHGFYSGDKSFKDITTIKLGGKILHYFIPNSVDDLKEVIAFLKKNQINFKIVGNGSNMLCSSKDYNGVVIHLKNLNKYEINDNVLKAQAGVFIPLLAYNLMLKGKSGLEFMAGIPGTIGGACFMNAGAYLKEISDILIEVEVLIEGEVKTLKKDDLKLSYRHSIFQEHLDWIILSASFKLVDDDVEKIKELMEARKSKRILSQPLDKYSCGSTFKNPAGLFSWQLINDIGYRGKSVGGIKVSEKHCNFLINDNHGTGEDFLKLAYEIKAKIKETYNIDMEMEIERFNFE